MRRCDEQEYTPVCGVCEGIGGVAWGDKNEEIKLTTCEPMGPVDETTLKRPLFGSEFTVEEYFEVLIGKKTDPFCFQAFPRQDSIGELCYRPQQGSQTYSMMDGQPTLRYDLEVKTKVGNVTSTVLHRGKNMWIVNHLPWYALGVKQCICTEPRLEGWGKVYPIQFNWTNHLNFIGRENLHIEYLWRNEIVDHWAFGPHHVWTYPESGQILRMWQPFNGLEVFPHGMNQSKAQKEKLVDAPPKMCTKAGAQVGTFRIGCDDEGYPKNVPPRASVSDLKRAKTKVPGDHFRGDGFGNMSNVLNSWLQKSGNPTKECEKWTVGELQKFQAQIYMLRNGDYDEIYQSAMDNRRLRRAVSDLQETWARNEELAISAGLEAMHRDGHCHEAVMWYVHHLDEEMKAVLAESQVQLPLLSLQRHDCDSSSAHGELCRAYEEKVSCASCHSNVIPAAEPALEIIA